MEGDDPVRLSAPRVHPDYCSGEIALKVGLREFPQAYIIPLGHIRISSGK